jgi:hypothetical protein
VIYMYICVQSMSKWFVVNGVSLNIHKTDVMIVNTNYFQDDIFKAFHTGKKINN